MRRLSVFRDRTIVERQGVCLAEGHTGAGVRSRRKRAWGQQGVLGLGRLGAASLPEAAPRAVWPGPAGGTTEPGPWGVLGPWLVGPVGASAPPQLLQLVGHLLQLSLDGRQALQLRVLGENTQSHPGAGAWSAQSACWLPA